MDRLSTKYILNYHVDKERSVRLDGEDVPIDFLEITYYLSHFLEKQDIIATVSNSSIPRTRQYSMDCGSTFPLWVAEIIFDNMPVWMNVSR